MTSEQILKNIDGKMLELVCEMEIASNEKWKEKLNKEYSTLKHAREAVEKQIKQPALVSVQAEDIKIGAATFKAGTKTYRCPCCGSWLTLSKKYCDACGQAIEFRLKK